MRRKKSLNMELWSVLPHYVDKTRVAKHFFRSRHKIVMISAPQGFLKSTNMRFMATFVDGVRHPSAAQQRKKFWLEMGLEIMKETELVDEFMGRWPYLHLSFGLSGARCSIHTMAALVRRLYEQHKLLVASDRLSATQRFNFDVYRNFADFKATGERKLADAVAVLCDILCSHYGRPVFVFIDNYDWPLLEALAKGKPLANVQPFLGRMLSSLYRSEAVQRVLLNGVSSFTAALEDTRVKVYRFLHEHKFCKYYGFTEADVASLLNSNHCSREIGSRLLERHYLSMGAKRKVYSPEWLLDALKHCLVENAVWFEEVLYKPVMTTVSLRRRLAPLERGEVARATVPRLPSSYSDLLQVNRLLNGDISDLEEDEVELVLRLLFEFGAFTPVEAASPAFSLACYHSPESVRLRMAETSRVCAKIKARAV